MPHRRPGAQWLALAFALVCAGCVTPPSARELLATGFRSPEQTFTTFQVAVRAREPDLQRRCFSSAFLRQNSLSNLNWREFQDELERQQPFLRKGIADARQVGEVEYRVGRARLHAKSHGRTLRIELVQEGFGELWAGAQRAVDENMDFGEHTGIQTAADGSRWFFAQLLLPPESKAPDITEMRLGVEWKIDALALLDDEAQPATAASSPHRE